LPADLDAVDTREHDVEDDDIGEAVFENLQGYLTVHRAENGVTLVFKVKFDGVEEVWLIVGDKHPALFSHPSSSP
jgi:hypothetical protein